MEIQPNVDMSWQSWACNKLNQATTYPSPYANVHKANLSAMIKQIFPYTMDVSIGCENELWKPCTKNVRENHLLAVKGFRNSLPSSHKDKQIHEKSLQFMASHCILQLAEPCIGIFAERVHPDPLHCKTDALQNILDTFYCEEVQIKSFFLIFYRFYHH